jgi:hypothetical protein
MPPKSRTGAKKVRRKERKNVAHGHAHIRSTFNNTIVSITDPVGVRQRPWVRTGDRHPVAAGDRPGGWLDPGRHPGSAQWLPPA